MLHGKVSTRHKIPNDLLKCAVNSTSVLLFFHFIVDFKGKVKSGFLSELF